MLESDGSQSYATVFMYFAGKVINFLSLELLAPFGLSLSVFWFKYLRNVNFVCFVKSTRLLNDNLYHHFR